MIESYCNQMNIIQGQMEDKEYQHIIQITLKHKKLN